MDENQKAKSIKFDMAYNFDKKLIEDISKFGIVSGVYAKMKHDDVGGGRASLILPEVSWQKIEEHVQLCHKNNIKFNYLLNALCLGNKEFVKEHHKKILELLDRVVNAKVDSVTVANPYICQMIKKQYPHLEVSISVNLRIRSLQQIRYWEGFGADEITLDQLVNRDFNLLREILKYTKQTGTRIRLFANNLCLHDCPLRTHHGLSNSHASQTGEYTTESHILYEYYLCTLLKMTSPAKLISATWIRPDDVHYYEELMNEVGNPNLSLKLVERGSTSEYLLKTVKAYSERRFDGNLMDIIYAIQKRFLLDNKKQAADDSNVFAERISKGEYNSESLRKLDNLFNLDWFHIDNRKLDGFLDKFKSKSCGNKICDDEGWRQSSCLDINSDQTCSYCRTWAEKAITVDEDKRRQYIEGIREFLDDLNSSKVFNLNKA